MARFWFFFFAMQPFQSLTVKLLLALPCINCDGSLYRSYRRDGYFSAKEGYFSAKEAGARTILYSLRKAKDLAFPKIHWVLYALKVIDVIDGEEDWSLKILVHNILPFANCIAAVKFSYMPRMFNRAAHGLDRFKFC